MVHEAACEFCGFKRYVVASTRQLSPSSVVQPERSALAVVPLLAAPWLRARIRGADRFSGVDPWERASGCRTGRAEDANARRARDGECDSRPGQPKEQGR